MLHWEGAHRPFTSLPSSEHVVLPGAPGSRRPLSTADSGPGLSTAAQLSGVGHSSGERGGVTSLMAEDRNHFAQMQTN